MLGSEVDERVQVYVRCVREGGGSISSRLVIAGAKCILLSSSLSLLVEYRGPVTLIRLWAHSLLKRLKFVRRKDTTAKSKFTPGNFQQLEQSFLEEVWVIIEMEEVPAELVLNWDKTAIKIVPSTLWTMEKHGSKPL